MKNKNSIFFLLFLSFFLVPALHSGSKRFVLYFREFEIGPFRGNNAYRVYKRHSISEYSKIPFTLNEYQLKNNVKKFFQKDGNPSVKLATSIRVCLTPDKRAVGFFTTGTRCKTIGKAWLKSTGFKNSYEYHLEFKKTTVYPTSSGTQGFSKGSAQNFTTGGHISLGKTHVAWVTASTTSKYIKLALVRLEKR